MTPQQARFTATSRLAPGNHGGYSQSVPVHAYGIKRPFNADYAIHDFSGIRKFPRSVDKSRGLRHFSTKVCEKVKEKGHTNYNEVSCDGDNVSRNKPWYSHFSNFNGFRWPTSWWRSTSTR